MILNIYTLLNRAKIKIDYQNTSVSRQSQKIKALLQ